MLPFRYMSMESFRRPQQKPEESESQESSVPTYESKIPGLSDQHLTDEQLREADSLLSQFGTAIDDEWLASAPGDLAVDLRNFTEASDPEQRSAWRTEVGADVVEAQRRFDEQN
jgi:hypothetical protein